MANQPEYIQEAVEDGKRILVTLQDAMQENEMDRTVFLHQSDVIVEILCRLIGCLD